MSTEEVVKEVVCCVCEHLNDNMRGLDKVNSEYWLGRVFATRDIIKSLRKILPK